LRYVRDNLGHESLKTTSQYLHSDDDSRHKETEQAEAVGDRVHWQIVHGAGNERLSSLYRALRMRIAVSLRLVQDCPTG